MMLQVVIGRSIGISYSIRIGFGVAQVAACIGNPVPSIGQIGSFSLNRVSCLNDCKFVLKFSGVRLARHNLSTPKLFTPGFRSRLMSFYFTQQKSEA